MPDNPKLGSIGFANRNRRQSGLPNESAGRTTDTVSTNTPTYANKSSRCIFSSDSEDEDFEEGSEVDSNDPNTITSDMGKAGGSVDIFRTPTVGDRVSRPVDRRVETLSEARRSATAAGRSLVLPGTPCFLGRTRDLSLSQDQKDLDIAEGKPITSWAIAKSVTTRELAESKRDFNLGSDGKYMVGDHPSLTIEVPVGRYTKEKLGRVTCSEMYAHVGKVECKLFNLARPANVNDFDYLDIPTRGEEVHLVLLMGTSLHMEVYIIRNNESAKNRTPMGYVVLGMLDCAYEQADTIKHLIRDGHILVGKVRDTPRTVMETRMVFEVIYKTRVVCLKEFQFLSSHDHVVMSLDTRKAIKEDIVRGVDFEAVTGFKQPHSRISRLSAAQRQEIGKKYNDPVRFGVEMSPGPVVTATAKNAASKAAKETVRFKEEDPYSPYDGFDYEPVPFKAQGPNKGSFKKRKF